VRVQFGCLTSRDKKVVGVFVRFRAPTSIEGLTIGAAFGMFNNNPKK
jgi:hypothetical protein